MFFHFLFGRGLTIILQRSQDPQGWCGALSLVRSVLRSLSQSRDPTFPLLIVLASVLDPEQTLKASKALLAYMARRREEGGDLMATVETIVVTMGLHQIPDNVSPYPIAIPVPHPLNADPRICLFAEQDGKAAKELLSKLGLSSIKVIGETKLRRKYKPYEMRRKLVGSYHLFACEAALQGKLRGALGKIFFTRNKYPTEVTLDGSLGKQIEALRTSTFMKPSNGVNWTIKVGLSTMEAKELAENAINAINGVVAKVPGQWTNIRGLHLKSERSIALPIYTALPEVGLEIEGASASVVSKNRVDPLAV